jgi:hypothetical protein
MPSENMSNSHSTLIYPHHLELPPLIILTVNPLGDHPFSAAIVGHGIYGDHR